MKSKKRKNYTNSFKEEAVKQITNEGYSFAEAGRNLGVNPNLIRRWKRELDRDGSEMPPEQLVAMRMATGRREVSPGLIFHSDRGTQYCSHKYQKVLRAHGIIPSMSRKGTAGTMLFLKAFLEA